MVLIGLSAAGVKGSPFKEIITKKKKQSGSIYLSLIFESKSQG